ncbi:uncharacterized protein LOC126844357 [Adelges cooleyi]|uniref:uncharacterized protein LOC126844357 n=1 Tax=Adelges cooleyi TaxID=133065 RepID=UPI00217FB782|nr:uncharacterized protein LOC126844357 [Adelges cooleyi]
MNVKYIFVLCFTMNYLVIQSVAGETRDQIWRRIQLENMQIRETFKITLQHLRLQSGQTLTLEQLVSSLGSDNARHVYQYFDENSRAANNRNNINEDLYGAVIRRVCEKSQQEVLQFLNKVNIAILSDKIDALLV